MLNVVQGLGAEAGAALVEHEDVDLVSFTGSAATGRWINETAGRRLAKVCLELGGKNALVVCDDADLPNAVRWALASAFSNAGQRCAAASRIVVFDAVYEAFREQLVAGANALEPEPVISEAALERMLEAVDRSRGRRGDGAGRRDEERRLGIPPRSDRSSRARRRTTRSRRRSCSARSRCSTASRASTRRSHSSTTRRTG